MTSDILLFVYIIVKALWSACENSYLSWTRNAVVCVVAGGSLFIAHDKMPRASLAGIGKNYRY